MKAQLLFPDESSLSTPSAARKLLRLLAGLAISCLALALCLFLVMVFNHEVSQHRRSMNAAMYEAQLELYKREALIMHFNREVLFEAVEPLRSIQQLSKPLSAHSYVNAPLGDPAKRWSVLLSGRDLRDLDEKRLNLLYVAPGKPRALSFLYRSVDSIQAVPEVVLSALAEGDSTKQGVRWLFDPQDGLSRVYLFMRVPANQDAGWLGLEIRGSDLSRILDSPQAGQFQLLDGSHRLVLGSGPDLSDGRYKALSAHDSFAFEGANLLPSKLALLKHVGDSNWALIYSIGIGTLLAPLWWPIVLAMLLALMGGAFAWRLCRRIDIRLIGPAQVRLEVLVESEAFLRAVIDAAPVALCVLGRSDGRVVLENRLAQIWLGGQEVRRQCYDWIVRSFARQDESGYSEVDLVEARPLYLSYMPTRYQGEGVLFCAFSDISARKETEATLARAKQLADSANEAKTQFLATMSHEIRTPLYGVLGTLELLGRTSLDSKQQGYLNAIWGSSSTLLQLISDILDVSKIESGHLELERVEFSPLELLQEVIQFYAATARNKGLQLYSCADPRLPERVRGDVRSLRQVLNNLLNNALKFTDSGRVVLRVTCEKTDAGRVILHWQVADTGIGISAEAQVRLFEPFYQAGDQARLVGGTGLGLSICMRLAKLMGGQLNVVSEVGLGSSFSLTNPVEPLLSEPDAGPRLQPGVVLVQAPVRELSDNLCAWLNRWGANARVVDGRESPGSELVRVDVRLDNQLPSAISGWQGCRVVVSGEGSPQPRSLGCDWLVGLHDFSGLRQAVALAQGCDHHERDHCTEPSAPPALALRVLVAEDNAINQLILHDQLEALGCVVELVSDGWQALQAWREERFDVVLTDLNMPRVSGYELASELRRRGCSIPIIGATASALNEEAARCLDAGMDYCLVKPVDLEALYKCLAPIQSEV